MLFRTISSWQVSWKFLASKILWHEQSIKYRLFIILISITVFDLKCNFQDSPGLGRSFKFCLLAKGITILTYISYHRTKVIRRQIATIKVKQANGVASLVLKFLPNIIFLVILYVAFIIKCIAGTTKYR